MPSLKDWVSRNLYGPVLYHNDPLAAAKTLITDPALSLRYYAFYCYHSSSLYGCSISPSLSDLAALYCPPSIFSFSCDFPTHLNRPRHIILNHCICTSAFFSYNSSPNFYIYALRTDSHVSSPLNQWLVDHKSCPSWASARSKQLYGQKPAVLWSSCVFERAISVLFQTCCLGVVG
jgi:hypothetical protein